MPRLARIDEGRSRSKLNARQVKMARERAAAMAADKASSKPSPSPTPKPERAPWDIPGKISDAVSGRRATTPRASARARQVASLRSRLNRPKGVSPSGAATPSRKRALAKLPRGADGGNKLTRTQSTNPFSRKPKKNIRAGANPRSTLAKKRGR